MFQTICDLIPVDADQTARGRRLDLMRRVLDGTLYDVLPYEFHDERTAGGEYIPLRRRRPSVRYALARVVVEDSVALLFSEGHFPAVASPDEGVRAALGEAARECRLNQVMIEAAVRGSIGKCVPADAGSAGAGLRGCAGYGLVDAGLGSGGSGHAGERDGAVQGAWGRPGGGRV